MAGGVLGLLVAGALATLSAIAMATPAAASASALEGIHKIQHVVMIMQENRSFDSYFGTYPGANGIPAGVCVPDPRDNTCIAPYHNPANKNYGGPHGGAAVRADVNGGRMDGFVAVRTAGTKC